MTITLGLLWGSAVAYALRDRLKAAASSVFLAILFFSLFSFRRDGSYTGPPYRRGVPNKMANTTEWQPFMSLFISLSLGSFCRLFFCFQAFLRFGIRFFEKHVTIGSNPAVLRCKVLIRCHKTPAFTVLQVVYRRKPALPSAVFCFELLDDFGKLFRHVVFFAWIFLEVIEFFRRCRSMQNGGGCCPT